MLDRSKETSGAGDEPSAAVRAGEVPELESRGELAMSKSLEHEKEDARHVPTLSAEQASARLEQTLGARWWALSNAEKIKLVESARASFQEAEQRKRLAKADPGASKPSADAARDTIHAAPETTDAPKATQRRDETRAAPEVASVHPPARVPEPTPAPSPSVPNGNPPVKRKRGRPPKVKKPDAGARGEDFAAGPGPASAPAPGPNPKRRTPDVSAAAEDPVPVFIADGPPPSPPGAAGAPALDPGAVLPGAAAVSLVAPDGVVASAVPPGGAPLAGRRAEGVVDGAFAGGYCLTVRVDGCLLRGIVWDDARATNGDVASDARR